MRVYALSSKSQLSRAGQAHRHNSVYSLIPRQPRSRERRRAGVTTMTPFFFPLLPLLSLSLLLFLSISLPFSPSLFLSLHHRRLSRLHSFSSTRSNLGNPFSSHTEIPRRTAFSLLATFHLLLLLPLLLRHRSSSSFSFSSLCSSSSAQIRLSDHAREDRIDPLTKFPITPIALSWQLLSRSDATAVTSNFAKLVVDHRPAQAGGSRAPVLVHSYVRTYVPTSASI